MTDREQPERDEATPQPNPPQPNPPRPGPEQPPPGGYPPPGYGPPPGYPPQGYPPAYPPGYPPPQGYPQQGGYPPQGYPPPGYPPPYPPSPGPPGQGWPPPGGGPPGWQAWPERVAVPRPPAAPVEQIPPSERSLSALAYLVPLVTSVGLLIVEKRRAAVRFHAAQALAVDVLVPAAAMLVTMLQLVVPDLVFLYFPVVFGGFTLPRLFLLVQSARGAHVRVPWLADFADARARTATDQAGPGT